MAPLDAVAQGRAAFAARRWREAHACLTAADRASALPAADIEQLGAASYLLGLPGEWARAWGRAYGLFSREGDLRGAARCAFWLSFGFLNGGEVAQGNGWLVRARHIIDEHQLDGPERGYVLLPGAVETCDSDPSESYAAFGRALEIGRRFADADLIALAQHGQGRALIRLGEAQRGMALLDEVLLSVTADELSPIVTGDIYCGVVEACHETFDLRRAQEWTAAMSYWCEAQSDLVPFRGQCLVYRAAMLQLRGEWRHAAEEVVRACRLLSEPFPHPAAGAAFYQKGEIDRLQGRFEQAGEAYRRASDYGRDPQPGLALTRLAEGQTGIAAASIRRAMDESADTLSRSRMLPATVEIMLAAGEAGAARTAAGELSAIASRFGFPLLLADGAYASGAVSFVEGDVHAALGALRRARAGWTDLGVPYDAARARVLIGQVCLALGDRDGAALEIDAARRSFERLGAGPDAARAAQLLAERGASAHSSMLTPRELQVLRLVAAGKTNRSIADELVISDKTVARHLSNIFDKLDVPSRAAATAYAYEHGLV